MRFDDLRATAFWAKSGEDDGHSLIAHSLDVAAVSYRLLLHEPPSTREWLARALGLNESEALNWVAACCGLHDLGKATAGFQAKWAHGWERLKSVLGKRAYSASDERRHDLSGAALWLQHHSDSFCSGEIWKRAPAFCAAAHHGFVSGLHEITKCLPAMEDSALVSLREELLRAFLDTVAPPKHVHGEFDTPLATWLAGLTAIADWIASNPEWFPYGFRDCQRLKSYYEHAKELAGVALEAIGWPEYTPLLSEDADIHQLLVRLTGLSQVSARELQKTVDEVARGIKGPSLLIVEAPMGEGKTEAAFLAHLHLQRANSGWLHVPGPGR